MKLLTKLKCKTVHDNDIPSYCPSVVKSTPQPPPPGKYWLVHVPYSFIFSKISYEWNQKTGFFHLTKCLCDSTKFLHVSIVQIFLLNCPQNSNSHYSWWQLCLSSCSSQKPLSIPWVFFLSQPYTSPIKKIRLNSSNILQIQSRLSTSTVTTLIWPSSSLSWVTATTHWAPCPWIPCNLLPV